MTKNKTPAKGLQDILDQLNTNEVSSEDLLEAQEIALQIADTITRKIGE